MLVVWWKYVHFFNGVCHHTQHLRKYMATWDPINGSPIKLYLSTLGYKFTILGVCRINDDDDE